MKDFEDLKAQFETETKNFIQLGDKSESLLRFQLEEKEVKFSSVKHRIKAWESFEEKCSIKRYENPFVECTDFLGLRVVVYLETDIEVVEALIRELFDVDDSFSIDKTQPESAEKFGYRSLHLICSLGDKRSELPEYTAIHAKKFEIQVRTALQDTWAEIEHKYNYKSEASLPSELQRKLYRASAILETVDASLSEVTAEAQKYAETVSEHSKSIEDDPITEVGLLAMVRKHATRSKRADQVRTIRLDGKPYISNKSALRELKAFGINTIGELDEILSKTKTAAFDKYIRTRITVAPIQFIRIPMIFSDPEKFFDVVDKSTMRSISERVLKLLEAEFPKTDIRKLVENSGIPVTQK